MTRLYAIGAVTAQVLAAAFVAVMLAGATAPEVADSVSAIVAEPCRHGWKVLPWGWNPARA